MPENNDNGLGPNESVGNEDAPGKSALPVGGPKKKAKGVHWLSPKELKDWRDKLDAAKAYRKADSRLEKWNEYLEYLNCDWDAIYEDDDEFHCNVNSIFSNLQTELPTLYFQHPHVNVKPKVATFPKKVFKFDQELTVTVDNIEASKLLEIRLNQVFDDMKIEPVLERAIADALAPFGHGWIKLGVGFQSEFDRSLRQKVTKSTYWARRVDPRVMLTDPWAPSLSERTYTMEEIWRPKDELLKNPLYVKERINDLKTAVPEHLQARADSVGKDHDPKLVNFIELHDHVNRMKRWVAESGTTLTEVRKPVKIKDWSEGSDYIAVELNVPTKDAYALSDVEPVIDQAKYRNRIRTAQSKHIENWGITVFIEENFWKDDETAVQWEDAGNNVAICKVKDDAIAQNRINVASPPPIPNDWYQMDEVHRRDNDETLGITDYQRGTPEKRTATEGQLTTNAANVRIARRRRKIKLAIIEIANKAAALVRAHDTQKMVLNVAGKLEDDSFTKFLREQYDFDADVPFLEVDKESWQGEYTFDFEIEEMIERPKAVMVQQLLNTMQGFATNPIFARAHAEVMDPAHVIRKIYEWQGIHVEELKKQKHLIDMPAELENSLAEQGIQMPDPVKGQDHARHSYQHLILAKEMQAKLPALLQGAQNMDPDAVEAYSLVKQAIQDLQGHVVKHHQMDKDNEETDTLLGTPPAGPGQGVLAPNGPSVPSQINPPAPAGPPNETQIGLNSGAVGGGQV